MAIIYISPFRILPGLAHSSCSTDSLLPLLLLFLPLLHTLFFFFPSRDFLEYLRQKNITKPNKKFSADIVCFRSWGCLIPWQRSDPLNASVAEPKLKWNAVGLGIRRA